MLSKEDLLQQFSKEEVIVILICRLGFETISPQDLTGWMKDQEINWKKVVKLLTLHSIRPFFFEQITKHKIPIPIPVLQHLKKKVWEIGKQNLWLFQLNLEILNDFANESIKAIPYKGPSFSLAAYGNINARESSDLDFLISARDLEKTIHFFSKNNYQAKKKIPLEKIDYLKKITKDLVFKKSDPRFPESVSIEMHWKLIEKFSGDYPAYEFFSNSLNRISIQNYSIPALTPTYQFIAIASNHFVKDQYGKFKYLIDLAMLMHKKQTEIDYNLIYDTAKKYQFTKKLNTGFSLIHDLIGIKPNDEMYPILKCSNDLLRIPLSVPLIQPFLSNWKYIKLNYQLQDNFKNKIKFIKNWLAYIYTRIYVDYYAHEKGFSDTFRFILESPLKFFGVTIIKKKTN